MAESNSASDETMFATAKTAFIRTFANALFDAEGHVRSRHINKSDNRLRRRIANIAGPNNHNPEKMSSTFTDTDFYSAALAVLISVLSDGDLIDQIVRHCVCGNSREQIFLAEFPMPENLHGHGITFCNGEFQRIECAHVRLVIVRLERFSMALMENPSELPDNYVCCRVKTFYPIR